MSDFLKGKVFSPQSKAVYDSAKQVFGYYHKQSQAIADASFYDIRKHFQGETNGKMNASSDDEHYNELIADLKNKMKDLAKKIEPKIYEYGFLV